MWSILWSTIGYMILAYLVLGHVQSWKWLLEARMKSVDLDDPTWSEYLNTLKGIVTFTVLGTLFWLPAVLLNISERIRRRRKKSKRPPSRMAMTWFQAFRKAVEIYRELLSRARNEIQ
ncbi:4-amino-4-deoxy-L-arabinose transferase-like glycosyltransferase [Paenibacillus mucilaginosus]